MKKYIYILASALLAVVACNKENLSAPVEAEEQDEKMVTIHFTVDIPDGKTRTAMSDEPVIDNLWVVEFGASGYYKRWVEATIDKVTTNGESGAKTYSVDLPMSNNTQYFHFIANLDEHPSFISQTEVGVIGSLKTTGNNGAFWQRVVVEGGIQGTKSGDSYVPTAETQALFANIPLIRNFARVKVKAGSGSGITIKEYALINTPTEGSIAPYDASSHSYVAPYSTVSDLNFDNVKAAYTVPAVEVEKTTSASELTYVSSGSLFMFERPMPTTNATAVLVNAEVGSTTGWFKLELLNGGQYVPIYRDFEYVLTINSISNPSVVAKSTAQEALEGAALGDVSSNLETASLTSVTDGTNTLQVSFTDYTEAAGSTSAVLYYKFSAGNSNVTLDLNSLTGGVTAIGTTFNGTGSWNGWTGVNLTLASPGASIKKSCITVTGSVEGRRDLYRNVYVRVMSQPSFTVTSDAAATTAGSSVTLTFHLQDDLGASLFPLYLIIEAEENNLTSTDTDLPVETQLDNTPYVSAFGSKYTYYFLKTITYADYYSITDGYTTDFPCHFTLTKDGDTRVKFIDRSGIFTDYTLTSLQ